MEKIFTLVAFLFDQHMPRGNSQHQTPVLSLCNDSITYNCASATIGRVVKSYVLGLIV